MEEFELVLLEAQRQLMRETMSEAIDMLYEQCAKRHQAEVMLMDPALAGKTKEEFHDHMMDAVGKNQFVAARAFNLVSKDNGIDLSLKTAGAKSLERADAKRLALTGSKAPWGSDEHNTSMKTVTDLARVSVVSSDVDVLDQFCSRIQSRLDEKKSENAKPDELEDWFMRPRAMLSKVLKSSVNGVGAEVQFLPRQQARCAARITYKYSTFARLFDEAMAGNEATLDAEQIELFNGAIDEYNHIAGLINCLTSGEPITADLYQQINAAMATKEGSSQTFDSGREGGLSTASDRAANRGGVFTPIFRHPRDLYEYASFLKYMMPTLGVDSLPIIEPLSAQTQMEKTDAMAHVSDMHAAIKTLAQATHICYMRNAKEPMRDLFVEKAMELNNTKGRFDIPKEALEAIDSIIPLTLNPAKGASHER